MKYLVTIEVPETDSICSYTSANLDMISQHLEARKKQAFKRLYILTELTKDNVVRLDSPCRYRSHTPKLSLIECSNRISKFFAVDVKIFCTIRPHV